MESIEEIRETIEGRKGSKPDKAEETAEEVVPEGEIVIREKDSKLTEKQEKNFGIDPLHELILDREIERRKKKKLGG